MNKLKLLIPLVIILALIGLFSFQRDKAGKKDPISTQEVTTLLLKPYITKETVTTYGETDAPQAVTLKAQQASVITTIQFTPGQKVKQGQLLFTLKDTNINNSTSALKAQELQSKSWLDREEELNKKLPHSVSEFALLKAKSKYEQDLAAYQEASSIENIQTPIAGTTTYTALEPGDLVSAGISLVKIIPASPIQVEYQLSSRYANQVHLGQKIKLFPNDEKKSYAGTVIYISPLLDPDNDNLIIRAQLENNSKIRPNTFGRIDQVINLHYKTLALPQTLVQTDSAGFYVYTLSKNNKVKKTYFIPGSVTQSGLIQVLSGIPENTPIISSNLSQLSLGETVRVSN